MVSGRYQPCFGVQSTRSLQSKSQQAILILHRYYVKTCAKPQKRAALALAVKIGSAVEHDDEQGVAHIVEHLAFNATEAGFSASSTSHRLSHSNANLLVV